MEKTSGNNSYLLELNDQLAWNLTGTEGTVEWLNRFTAILKLEAGIKTGLPEIRFVRGSAPGYYGTLGAEKRPDRHVEASARRLAPTRSWHCATVVTLRPSPFVLRAFEILERKTWRSL